MLHYIEGPKNILADKFSRLQRLISPVRLAEGNKLINTVAVSDDEDADDAYFLDLEFSVIIYNYINEALEWFINLSESYAPEQKPLIYYYICEW